VEITLSEVEYVANLARMALSEAEKARLRDELSRILAYVAKLNELDTTGIPPMKHTLQRSTPLRADKVRPSMPREEALANAPDARQGSFAVPLVMEE
jgi:aspartyl-tRNA(Asn)/glutamyl-tRNA(Gln) amidotransferase subunit C